MICYIVGRFVALLSAGPYAEGMIRMIVAMDRKQGIAKNGFQPWSIPGDEAYFSDMTKRYGGKILTGSTTFKLALKQPLVDRENFVLTHEQTPLEGVTLVHDLEKFLHDLGDQDLWVIGGANVYAQVLEMNKADELYITAIEADFGCTQFFPPVPENFKHIEQSDLHEQNGFIYTYNVFKKEN